MKTQSDQRIRVVALSNLRAMCERVSGTMCHQFEVVKASRSRVHVEYSNENEYATAEPMVAVFPCYPGTFDDDGSNPSVILAIVRVLHDNWNGEGWQAFQPLLDCPTLWRDPNPPNVWKSHSEIVAADGREVQTRDSCVVCDVPVAYEATCHACGWKERQPTHMVLPGAMRTLHASCPPSEHGIARTPDVIVRTITRAEVQS